MNGQRRYWRPGQWVQGRLVHDVDVPDDVIKRDFTGLRWPVLWGEAEQLTGVDSPAGSVEMWEVRHKRWGGQPIVRNYVVDAALWIPVGNHRSTGFWQTTSFWRRADALSHAEQLQRALARMSA